MMAIDVHTTLGRRLFANAFFIKSENDSLCRTVVWTEKTTVALMLS